MASERGKHPPIPSALVSKGPPEMRPVVVQLEIMRDVQDGFCPEVHLLLAFRNRELQSRAQLACEYALENPNAHCGLVGQLLHRQILMKVFRNPNMELMNRLHFRCLCRQGSAQLSSPRSPRSD